MGGEAQVPTRRDFRYFKAIPTRWNDNDMLGHVNNVMYYSYFEAVIVQFLMERAGLDWLGDARVPLAVETLCRFQRPVSFPEVVEAGLRIGKVGRSSLRYEIGLFIEGDETPAATGHFVHVWTDRNSGKPAPIPDGKRAVFEKYV